MERVAQIALHVRWAGAASSPLVTTPNDRTRQSCKPAAAYMYAMMSGAYLRLCAWLAALHTLDILQMEKRDCTGHAPPYVADLLRRAPTLYHPM